MSCKGMGLGCAVKQALWPDLPAVRLRPLIPPRAFWHKWGGVPPIAQHSSTLQPQ